MKIEVCHVEKSLKGRKVLKDISCVMESGKIYGLYGHNGSGKTTLMRCIIGLIHIDRGNIIIDGKKLGKDIDFPQSVGAIIENPIFFPYATGFENLKILADIKGMIGEKEIRTPQSIARVMASTVITKKRGLSLSLTRSRPHCGQ